MVFMQNGAKCHNLRSSMNFLKTKRILKLNWPPQSAGINSIWDFVKMKLYKDNPPASSREELINFVFEIWDNLTLQQDEATIDRLGRVMEQIKRNRGDITVLNRPVANYLINRDPLFLFLEVPVNGNTDYFYSEPFVIF